MVRLRVRGFTLIELLIVIAIISILSALLIPGVLMVQRRVACAAARSKIEALRTALASYHSDTGTYPGAFSGGVFDDQAGHLYAGLQNVPGLTGGGPSSPYLSVRMKEVGIMDADRSCVEVTDEERRGPLLPTALPIEENPAERDAQLRRPPIAAPPPGVAPDPESAPFVLLDPWGNFLHYRVWEQRQVLEKKSVVGDPTRQVRCGSAYEIWSNGPDGINDYGEGDDITSW